MNSWPLNRREFVACGTASLMASLFSQARATSGPNLDAVIIDPAAVTAQRFLQALAVQGIAPHVMAYEPRASRLPLTGLPDSITHLVVFLSAAQAYVVEQHALMRGYRLRLAAQPLGAESGAMIDHYSANQPLLEMDIASADWAQRCARLCGALHGADLQPHGKWRRHRVSAVPNDSATLLLLQKVQRNASVEAAS